MRDSDGNLVNLGNFDSKGANVNRRNPDNANSNLGVCFSRSVQKLLDKFQAVFVYLIQPPVIFPISIIFSSNLIYLF